MIGRGRRLCPASAYCGFADVFEMPAADEPLPVTSSTAAPASSMPAPHVPVSHGRVGTGGNGRAVRLITAATSSGVIFGLAAYSNAATPATCGAAMLVP